VLDSDIANEIDDPFAIAHALLSPDQIDLRAITMAPFGHSRVPVEQSQDLNQALGEQTLEALKVRCDLVRGAESFCADGAVMSAAVKRIIDESQGADPLYVLAIGAATNVASALLVDPSLVERIVVVWLGGHAPDYRRNDEYNLNGDRFASEVLFASGVPLVHYPAIGVTSHLLVSAAQMEADLGDSAGAKFFSGLLRGYVPDHFGYAKELWDVGVTSYLVNPEWTNFVMEPTPSIGTDCRYQQKSDAPVYKRATMISRNSVVRDLFTKLRGLDSV
jgi:inosine-uridine nucleoside N-ribohydrolase